MNYFKKIDDFSTSRKTAVTLGKFDGFHRGHQALLVHILEYQKTHDVDTLVVAFDMKPLMARLYEGMGEGSLMTNAERRAFLDAKVNNLVECPFTEEFCHVDAEDFIKDFLIKKFHAAYVVVGEDFRFGYQQLGDVDLLKEYGKKYGFEVKALKKERYKNRIISSSYIREEVARGSVERARKLLGYGYSISGKVEHGMQLGRTLGFPTMNIIPDPKKLLPPRGVYATKVLVDGKWYPAISNIGIKPTITSEKKLILESFLFDYSGNTYGKIIRVKLYSFIRGEIHFESVGELKKQVEKDIVHAKHFFTLHS